MFAIPRPVPLARLGGFMLALIAATASVEAPLQNGVSLTADLTNGNGEPKTYKLLLDVNVR